MLFEQFFEPGLAHYSYAVGCPAAGQVSIVDPKRDVDTYLQFATRLGLEITHVLETHIHADYASGAVELAQKTGAEHLVSGCDQGEVFEVSFPHSDLFSGESVRLGSVRIEALHTPGHTPEHLSFLVYDQKRSESVPLLMLSGDFLFVGSLGRPDLLGEESSVPLACQLFESSRSVLAQLPDFLEIYPGHGAGSMCGAGMSARSMTTLGFERLTNPYLRGSLDQEGFVETILSNVPPFPPYYRKMKRLNSQGPPLLNGLPGQPLGEDSFGEQHRRGATIVDLRDPDSFARAHIPGSICIGAGPSLSTWASWVISYDRPLLLLDRDDSAENIEEATRSLIRVGLDQVVGHLKGGWPAWQQSHRPTETLPQLDPVELHQKLMQQRDILVLDVRSDDEWREGHIAQAMHLMAGYLPERLDEIPSDRKMVAVICGGGYRSTVAASFLQREGISGVFNVSGGMQAWAEAGFPVVA